MATVPNKGDLNVPIDPPLTKHNRKQTGAPAGSLLPLFSGEIVLDTGTDKLYQAQDLTVDGWVEFVRNDYH